jgi:hypothetical protein
MITYVRHFAPYIPLAALVNLDGDVHQLAIVVVEARVLATGVVEHHPVVVLPTGEVRSLVDMARGDATFQYRIDTQARLGDDDHRARLEEQIQETP